jgi:peptide/nickel transport system permease protein
MSAETTSKTLTGKTSSKTLKIFILFIKRFLDRKIVLISSIIILLFIIAAAFSPFIAPHDPYEVDLTHSLLKPNTSNLLGTDAAGRDVLSRIIFGARVSLLVGVISVIFGSVIGFTLGLIAGYFGGIANRVIMRFIDALMSLPPLLLALIVAALLGGGVLNVMLAIGMSMVPTSCRLMCAQALSIKGMDYILAGRSIGCEDRRLIIQHMLPNCLPPLIVLMTMELGMAILAEAGLSFLGIGIMPPLSAWGSMVSEGQKYLGTYPVISLAPGVAIMLVVFAFNMVGDGLRDALDPRLRGIL